MGLDGTRLRILSLSFVTFGVYALVEFIAPLIQSQEDTQGPSTVQEVSMELYPVPLIRYCLDRTCRTHKVRGHSVSFFYLQRLSLFTRDFWITSYTLFVLSVKLPNYWFFFYSCFYIVRYIFRIILW